MNFAGVNLAAGQTFTRTFQAGDVQITTIIDQISFTYSATGQPAPSTARLQGYQPGSYAGDGLDDLYNIGGAGQANTLTNALFNYASGTNPIFRFRAYATLNGAPIRLGLVFASAEDDADAAGGVNEFTQGTTNGSAWQLLEKYTPTTGRWKNVILWNNDQTVRLQMGSTTSYGTTGPGNVALMYTGKAIASSASPLTVSMQLRGGGRSAMAIGLILDEDYGDAPASYGTPSHVYFPVLSGGTNPNPGVAQTTYLRGPETPVINAGTLNSPRLYLGTTPPDADQSQQSSALATGDDADGNDDENAIGTPPRLATCQTSYALTVSLRNTSGAAASLGGGIDFNRNGVFDTGEFAVASVANGATSAVLTWNNLQNRGLVGGQSFIRLRLSSRTIVAGNTVNTLPDGEVEDHPITIYAPPVVSNPPNQVICNGGNASFAATVTGATAYQWQQSTNGGSTWTNLTNGVNGGVTVAGATTTTLTLTAVPTSWTTRRYRLVASNSANPAACRSTNSGAAVLTVIADPVATSQPPSRTLCVGGTTTMSAGVSGGTGTATITWQRLAPGGSWTNITATLDGSRYTNFTTSTLTISNVAASMTNYQYRRVTTYSGSGCGAVYSAAGRLTVVADPVITDQPDNLTVCAPGDIIVTAQATGGIGALTYQWQQSIDNGTTWANLLNGTFSDAVISGVFSPTLRITDYPATWNGRRYRLVVGNAAGASLGCTNQVTSTAAIITAQSGGPKITQPPLAQPVCVGGTATFAVSVSGTSGTVLYQWQQSTDNGSTWTNLTNGTSGGVTIVGSFSNTLSLTNLTAAFNNRRYRVVVNDNATCNPVSAGALLTVNPNPVVTIDALNGTICAGSRDTLETTITGGAGTMAFQWAMGTLAAGPFTTIPGANGSALATDDNLPAGTYYYRVTVTPTGSGCSSATAVAAVTVNARPSVAVLSGGGTICPDGTTSIQVAVTGGTAPYVIQYLEGTSLETVDEYTSGSPIGVAPTAPTAYSLVSVTDENGCSSPAVSGGALVTVTGGITSASIVGGATVCAGSSSTIAVAIEGGVGPYQIIYSDGVTSYTATNYSPGSPISVTIGSEDTSFELVSVTDAAGCSAPDEESTADFVVLEKQFAADALLSACNDGTGMAVFDLTQANVGILNGLTGSVQYYRDSLLTQSITNANVFSSAADTVYARVIQSPQGCIDTARVVLELNTIQITVNAPDSVCLNQPIQISVSQQGAIGTPTFTWSGPNGFTSTGDSLVVSSNATAAMSGDYIVTVTDVTGCISRDTITITVDPCCSLTALSSSSSVAACVGSTVSFSVTFGGAQGATTVVWRGPNGFTATTTVVTIPSATTAHSGTYSYTVTDGMGCTAVGSIQVTIDNSINARAEPQSACVGQPITLIATSGGTSYQWSGPNGFATTVSVASIPLTTSATIAMAGTYTVVVTGAGGCSGTATALVMVNPATSLLASASALTVCSGDEILITYTPTPAEAEVSWIRQPDGGIGTGNIVDFLTSIGTSPASYTYVAYISAVSGCQSNTVTTVVTVNPRPSVTPSSYEQAVCAGQEYNLAFTTDMPATVQWRLVSPTPPAPLSGTGDITATAPATPTSQTLVYQAWAVASGSSCSIGDTIETWVIVSPGLQVSAFANSATVCVGSPLSLSASVLPAGTYTYAWTGPNGYVSASTTPQVSANAALNQSGNYTVVVSDVSGCSGTAVVPVVVDECLPACDLVASVSSTPSTNCTTPNGSFTLTYSGSGSYQYSLNGGGNIALTGSPLVVSNLAPGSYTVVVSDVSNVACVVTQLVTIAAPELLAGAFSNAPVCAGSTVQLGTNVGGGTAPYTYTWSGPSGFNASTATPTIPNATTAVSGLYSVTITDAGGCSATASTEVLITNAPSLSLTGGNSQTICSGQSTTLTIGGSNGSTVIWSSNMGQDGTGNSIPVQYTNAGTGPILVIYTLNATSGICSDTESVTVVVNPEPRIQVMPSAAVYCNIEQVNLTANAFPATATINWTRTPNTPNPPADSGSGTGTVTINQTLPAANYTFGFTATNPVTGCTSQPLSVPVTVQQ